MTTPDEKYVVFKRSDWDRFVKNVEHEIPTDDVPGISPLTDAVVLRTKDQFAGPALHAYCGAVLSAAEMVPRGELQDSARASLVSIADYFHERANEADEKRRIGAAGNPD